MKKSVASRAPLLGSVSVYAPTAAGMSTGGKDFRGPGVSGFSSNAFSYFQSFDSIIVVDSSVSIRAVDIDSISNVKVTHLDNGDLDANMFPCTVTTEGVLISDNRSFSLQHGFHFGTAHTGVQFLRSAEAA